MKDGGGNLPFNCIVPNGGNSFGENKEIGQSDRTQAAFDLFILSIGLDFDLVDLDIGYFQELEC